MLHHYARDKSKPITFPATFCPCNKPLVILGLVTLVAFFLLPYAAQATAPVSVQTTGQAQWLQPENQTRATETGHAKIAEQLTARLTGLLTAYNKASENAKANALDELVAVAEERHALLARLIEDDPGTVLRVALPAKVRNSMPADVRHSLEQSLDLEGELTVLYEEYEDGRARLRHLLNTGGKHIAMHFRDNPPQLLSGEQVVAQGVYLDLDGDPEAYGAMALESGQSILTLAAAGGKTGGSNGGTASTATSAFGDQKTLLILVSFQDQPTEPYTATYAQSVVFGTVSDHYRENSYGQTWLSGDVYGWFTIDLDSTVCDLTTLASQANSAAQAAGANLANYAHIVYAFQNSCGGKGVGTVGGSPSQAWINGELDVRVIAHELGHGLGLWHSNSLECGSTTLGPDCYVVEYGDPFDSMGNQDDPGHFNAFQKERLGWLKNDVYPAITTVTASGTYTVAPLEANDTRPKVLKILKSTDTTTGQRTWYYLEWRQAIGFDAFLADNTNVLNGLLLHTGTDGDGNSSNLLDMTPASQLLKSWDWLDPALATGGSFEDPDAGIVLRTEWVTSTEAAVTVYLDSQSTDPPTDPPTDQSIDQLAVTVSTDRPSYLRNESVSVTAKVTSETGAIANAAVNFTVTKPDGRIIGEGTTTGADGTAMYKLRLKKQDPVGNYQVDTCTTINGLPASAKTAFSVR
jgi:hypothetical protein